MRAPKLGSEGVAEVKGEEKGLDSAVVVGRAFDSVAGDEGPRSGFIQLS